MSVLINSLKSDLDALLSQQSQAAGLLSVNPTEERRVEALNHVYAMVPLVRDMHARLEALEEEINAPPAVAEVAEAVEVPDGVRLSVPVAPQPAATVTTAQSSPAEPLSFNKE